MSEEKSSHGDYGVGGSMRFLFHTSMGTSVGYSFPDGADGEASMLQYFSSLEASVGAAERSVYVYYIPMP